MSVQEKRWYTLPEARLVAKHLQAFYRSGKDMRGYFRAVCDRLGYKGKEYSTMRINIHTEIARIEPQLLSLKNKKP